MDYFKILLQDGIIGTKNPYEQRKNWDKFASRWDKESVCGTESSFGRAPGATPTAAPLTPVVKPPTPAPAATPSTPAVSPTPVPVPSPASTPAASPSSPTASPPSDASAPGAATPAGTPPADSSALGSLNRVAVAGAAIVGTFATVFII